MSSFKISIVALLGMIAFSWGGSLVSAAGFPEPKVEYSADQSMGTDGQVVKSKVFHAPGKQRMEMDGGAQVVITRYDKKVSWVLMPEQKMYMEVGLDQRNQGAGSSQRDMKDCSVSSTAKGSESVNGVTATRSEIDMSCPDGTRFSGSMWQTKDGIVVKMDAVSKGASGSQGNIKTELKNLKVGKVDPALFEVPVGYQTMSMPSGAWPGVGAVDIPERRTSPPPRRRPAP
jgi:hypothetical protein